MNVLIINCGSSSLKFQVINSDSEEVIAKGLCERIGVDGRLVYQPAGKDKEIKDLAMPTHDEAVAFVIEALTNPETGVLSSLDEIDAIGHRVVHGGEKFTKAAVVTDEVVKAIEEVSPLAPLHNPAAILGLDACKKLMPNKKNVVVFDTAFHQTMPSKAFMYAVPYEQYEKHQVRRYGFHGTSHMYVSRRVAELDGADLNNSKIIVAHLGNGGSISAVLNGKCVDTSMGLTPLEGLVMGTRSGDIDASAITYMAEKNGKSADEIITMLNKESGVLGVSGVSSDFRDLAEAASNGNERAQLALDMFAYRVAKYIGSYAAAMNGVDIIAFTAGIGENNGMIRGMITNYLEFLGLEIDEEANKVIGDEKKISTANSKIKAYVVPTNEELAICRETVALVK